MPPNYAPSYQSQTVSQKILLMLMKAAKGLKPKRLPSEVVSPRLQLRSIMICFKINITANITEKPNKIQSNVSEFCHLNLDICILSKNYWASNLFLLTRQNLSLNPF